MLTIYLFFSSDFICNYTNWLFNFMAKDVDMNHTFIVARGKARVPS